MTRIHHFDSTEEAYDASQVDGDVKDGDVLVIEAEQVVGVAETWPFAVTEEHGALHTLRFAPEVVYTKGEFRLTAAKKAENIALSLGFPLRRYKVPTEAEKNYLLASNYLNKAATAWGKRLPDFALVMLERARFYIDELPRGEDREDAENRYANIMYDVEYGG